MTIHTLIRRGAVIATALGSVAAPFAVSTTASAQVANGQYTSVCPETPRTQCNGRVFPEATDTTVFLQYKNSLGDPEFEPAIKAVAALAPRFIEVIEFDELSAGGEKIFVVKITDSEAPATGKMQTAASLSIHGLEPAGREGGPRFIEDMAIFAQEFMADGTDHIMCSGDTIDINLPECIAFSELMKKTETYIGFLNPDGWRAGDTGQGAIDCPTIVGANTVGFQRFNDNCVDLNREFPTIGWNSRNHTFLSEPESDQWSALLDSFPNFVTAIDLHGENTTPTGSYSDMIWPAGEWSPRFQLQELRFAQNMVAAIERTFDEDGVQVANVATDACDPNAQVACKPAQFATAYDIVDYNDNGFLGDHMIQRPRNPNNPAGQKVVEIDIEQFLSNLTPSNNYLAANEQAHVAGTRGILEAMMVEATITDSYVVDLDIKKVAYVFDPETFSSSDANLFGFDTPPTDNNERDTDDFEQYSDEMAEPYSGVTRMKYFDDLKADTGADITAINPADIANGSINLSQYDSVVVAGVAFPQDISGRAYSASDYADALFAFAEAGGQLLLTDAAVELVEVAELVPEGSFEIQLLESGEVIYENIDHPFVNTLQGFAKEMYYGVPVGFPADGQAAVPAGTIAQTAWETAGGLSIGLSGGETSVGTLDHGEGVVTIYGAILPRQDETTVHLNGLSNYAVTVNGGAVLHEMLSFVTRFVDDVVEPPVEPPVSDDERPRGGGGAVWLLLPILFLGLRRQRRI